MLAKHVSLADHPFICRTFPFPIPVIKVSWSLKDRVNDLGLHFATLKEFLNAVILEAQTCVMELCVTGHMFCVMAIEYIKCGKCY